MSKNPASLLVLALRCRRGAAMVEYALLAGFIALVAVASVRTFGNNVNSKFVAILAAM